MSPVKSPFLNTVVDGMLWIPKFPKENYFALKTIVLRDGDVILSTYPKCGTNWVACIIWLILHPEEDEPTVNKIMSDVAFVEKDGLTTFADRPDTKSRVMFTHIPSERIPKDSCAKYISVVRNPFDCVVSLYHFLKGMALHLDNIKSDGESVNNDFFEWFLAGEIPPNDFFEHVKSWYNRRQEENVLFLTYEDLKKDHRGGVLKIAKFLGREEAMTADGGKQLDKVVHQSSFNYMKENFVYETPMPGSAAELVPMVRKGKVGGFNEALTPEQIERLREKMETELAGTDLLNIWGKIIKGRDYML